MTTIQYYTIPIELLCEIAKCDWRAWIGLASACVQLRAELPRTAPFGRFVYKMYNHVVNRTEFKVANDGAHVDILTATTLYTISCMRSRGWYNRRILISLRMGDREQVVLQVSTPDNDRQNEMRSLNIYNNKINLFANRTKGIDAKYVDLPIDEVAVCKFNELTPTIHGHKVMAAVGDYRDY